MSEPRTEAGRKLLAFVSQMEDGRGDPIRDVTSDILAIEAEAAELNMDALIEAGFLDAYLNIRGVEDEAQAQAMLEGDVAEYGRALRDIADREAVRKLGEALG